MVKKPNILAFVMLLFCIGCTQQEVRDAGYAAESDVEVYPQLGHSMPIMSVTMSSDGKYALSGSKDENLKLWDVATGREIRTFVGHTGWVSSVTISSDGKYALSGSHDKTLKLWDLGTGQVIRTFLGHANPVDFVAMNPNGKYALSGSSDNTLKLWDIDTGREIRTFEEDSGYVYPIAISPDWKYALSKSMEKTFKLWEIATGIEIRTFNGYPELGVDGSIDSIAFSPDGKFALSVGGFKNKTFKLWEIATGREIRTFEWYFEFGSFPVGLIDSVAFSPDGKFALLVGGDSWDKVFKQWDIDTGQLIRTFTFEWVSSVTISHDGKYALTTSWDDTLELWDIAAEEKIKTFKGSSGHVYSIAINTNENSIISAFWDGTLKLWDIDKGRMIRTFEGHTGNVSSVTISSDGKYALSGSWDTTLKLWDIATGQVIRTLRWEKYETTEWHRYRVSSVTISPDGKFILSAFWDGTLKLWELATGREISRFTDGSVTALSHDGRFILFRSADNNTLKLWEIATDQIIKTFDGYIDYFFSVAFSPDGEYILSGHDDGILKLWNITTGEETKTFEGHNDWVSSVAISPDGRYALSGSADKTLKLWNLATGQEIRTFLGHTFHVSSVTFSPDGKNAISTSHDGTVRLWDIVTGLEIASFISFDDGEWIVITPDGYYNASPKGDEHLNIRIGNQVFGIDQFAAAFYQPEVVQARLQGKKDPPAVKLRGDIRQATVPPGVNVVVNNKDTLRDTAELTVTIFDQFKPIRETGIEITVNGRLIGENELRAAIADKDITTGNTSLLASSQKQQLEFTIPVKLDPGFNYIEVIAANDYSYGSKRIILNAPETETPQKGDLYVLAIGVNKYTKNKSQSGYANLERSASDADKIINSFIHQGGTGKRYNQVHTLCLSDNETIKPTKQAILKSLKFLKEARPHDTVVLLMSGHGRTENGAYYFMPSDTVFDDKKGFKPQSAVNTEELVKALDIPGRKIVLLDTCESGGVDVNRLVRTLKNRSTVVFTASQDGEYAYENGKYGGYFTHSIAEGIGGKAAGSDNEVLITTLGRYITERVWNLNEETGTALQHPMKYIPDGYRNFVISMRAD
jgi:WD40 repeat protein